MLEDSLDEKGMRYLDSFIKTLEDSFPYSDVYFRMAKNENDINTTSLEYEEVYNIAIDMIESIKEINGDIPLFLDSIDNIDFFMKYPNVVKDLREDYK